MCFYVVRFNMQNNTSNSVTIAGIFPVCLYLILYRRPFLSISNSENHTSFKWKPISIALSFEQIYSLEKFETLLYILLLVYCTLELSTGGYFTAFLRGDRMNEKSTLRSCVLFYTYYHRRSSRWRVLEVAEINLRSVRLPMEGSTTQRIFVFHFCIVFI